MAAAEKMDRIWALVNKTIRPEEKDGGIRTLAGVLVGGENPTAAFMKRVESNYRDVIYLTAGRLGIVSIKPLDEMGMLKSIKVARAAERGDLSGVADVGSIPRSEVGAIALTHENPPGLNAMLGHAGLNTFVQIDYSDGRPSTHLWVDEAIKKPNGFMEGAEQWGVAVQAPALETA